MMAAKNKSIKREAGKLVVLNEEELIRQVESRPILYDKSLKGYRKSALRYQYWKEVGEVVGATVEECRRRWRSLRDAFSKHYKYLNRSEDAALNKRKKWVFYDQMSFMAHYLDNAYCEIEDTLLEDFPDNSDDDHTMVLHAGLETCPLNEMDAVDETILHHIEVDSKISVASQSEKRRSISDENQFIANIIGNTTPQTPQRIVKIPQVSDTDCKETTRGLPPEDTPSSSSSSVAMCLDSDEKFLMSCAPILQRLTRRKNALARLRIQQILYNIEFDTDES